MNEKLIIIYIILGLHNFLSGQPNCEAFIDADCKRACELVYEAIDYPQGSKRSQELFDESTKLCSNIAYAHYEKSVPYLKRGLFKEWKELIDKAVAVDSIYLLERGINQVQFMRNYEGGLDDLNELSLYLGTFNIGYSPSGEYHGQLIRAICYQKLGQLDQAIEISEKLINSASYHRDMYDYFHIGIFYLENGDLDKAKVCFEVQNESYEYAETYYYYAKVYDELNKPDIENEMLLKAQELYRKGQIMSSNYYHYIDKIYLIDIENKLD